jgi:tRNA pseudouridine55 synthase
VAAAQFVGEIDQIPPMVSAVKVGGRRLHEMARHGMTVEREPRRVRVDRFDVTESAEPGVLDVVVDCSSGTYVRTLAADLGTALGGGAHLRNLRRTAIGSFTVDEASQLDAVDASSLLTAAEAFRDYAQLSVSADVALDIAHGKVLSRDVLSVDGNGPWGIVDSDGSLLAIYEPHKGSTVKPAVVLNAE